MTVKLDLELDIKQIGTAKAAVADLDKPDKPDFFKDYTGAYSSGLYPGRSPKDNRQDT